MTIRAETVEHESELCLNRVKSKLIRGKSSLMNVTEETKKRFSETHSSLYSFVIVALSMLAAFLISNVLQSIGSIVIMAAKGEVSPKAMADISTTASTVLTLIAYVIVFLIYRLTFGKKLSSLFFCGKGTGKGILLGWSVLLINVVTLGYDLFSGKTFGNVGTALLFGITPGLTEEILCRIIPLSLVMRSPDRKKLMLPGVVFTSVIFGLSHMVNIFSGADPVSTLFQVLYATGTGFLFGAIYIRTGNPWITVILHSLTDIIFYLGADAQTSGGVLSQNTGFSDAVFLLVYAVLYFVNAYFVFRKNNTENSAGLWSRIWGEKAEV